MNASARWIVAGMLLFFAWRGAQLQIEWPLPGVTPAKDTRPEPADLKWAEGVQKIAAKMTPKDRLYCANFYEALRFVLHRDGKRSDPIMTDTTKFEAFHAGSLKAAVDREDVGKYDGLGEAIDETFVNAAGASVQNMTPEVRGKLLAACGVLAWTFAIHGE